MAMLRQAVGQLLQRLGAALRWPGPGKLRMAELRMQRPRGAVPVTAVQRDQALYRVITGAECHDALRRKGERALEDDVLEEARLLVREHGQRRLEVCGAREHNGLPDPVVGEVRELGGRQLDVAGQGSRSHGSTG